jgi:hypothetical protein
MYYWTGLNNEPTTKEIVKQFKIHLMLKPHMITKMQTSSIIFLCNESKDGINRNSLLIKVSTQAILIILSILSNHP